ncbi:Protein NBR1-like protein [Mucuna pruriens]|uniref:Protein NBR1-like protein n=1 Tax=Mucuna pruriens TaxID=157652 RepID=A0A371G835_MUCPR|nr:Protein NBR1-like protein [Mucuna pruriens]
MEFALVIKVKYGDTLRRFSARVDENNCLDLDMVGLRAKICSIFSFSANANLILRYVDEDGDLVTLVDDDDLRDVMRQQLKFLRIEVHMNNDGGGKSNAGRSGIATPQLTSPRVSNPFLGSDVIAPSSLPDPVYEAFSKLSLSKASSSSPVVENLANSFLKMGESILNSHFQLRDAAGTSSRTGVPVEPITSETLAPQSSSQLPANLTNLISLVGQSVLNSYCQPHVAAGPFSKNGVPEEPITAEARGSQIPSVDTASNGSQQVEAGNVIRSVTTAAEVAAVDLNIPPCDPSSSQSTNVNKALLSSEVPDGDGKKDKMSTFGSFAIKGDSCGTSTSSAGPNNSSTQTTSLSSGAVIDCPFSGTYPINSWTSPPLGNSRIPSFKRSHSHTEATTGMFHKGVRCDGCGVYPITGPRFKSKVKENYDLCNICFNEMGNESDYIRMDRPTYIRMDRPMSARAPRCIYEHTLNIPKLPPHVFKKGAILKHARPKLDSRFILDVNVIDGTMMAPSTAFTKIWRMRNNGTLVWPRGTQLVWIGGDKFSDSHSVDLEVLEGGVPVENELDIAVDFTAPQLPGRYISYWRMATSSGHKFGQRVWVLIQVDASLKDSFYDSSQGLNLNIPLDVSGSKGPQVIDINVQPIEDETFLQTRIPNAPTEPVNQMVDKEPMLELKNEFPINEATFVAPAASAPAATSAAPSPVSYPTIDLSETAPAVPSHQQSSTGDVPSSSVGIGGINSVEESLLKELEEMGFRQVDLNKEILRKNEYDLEQSVDDLCSVDLCDVSEWDPILEELQEMGFRDKEMNKRLLKKNNGSIKLVVMDLINGDMSFFASSKV